MAVALYNHERANGCNLVNVILADHHNYEVRAIVIRQVCWLVHS